MKTTAFVGDIHGTLPALDGMLQVLRNYDVGSFVFLGDYINKGKDSKAVLSRLISLAKSGSVTLLRGNHETALLKAIDHRDLSGLIKMGGAPTIRAYLGGDAGPDVAREFIGAVPREHVEAIRSMPDQFRTTRVLAQHEPIKARQNFFRRRFVVTAHRPVGALPRVGARRAEIDTGCGDTDGRLTAFLWPARRIVQVDSTGQQLVAKLA